MKILTIIGARPQIIKAAAISREISKNHSDTIIEIIVHTGQHYDNNMSNVFFEELSIPRPNYNLNVGSSSHGAQSARMIEGIEKIINLESPQYILLYGDTNSTLAGAVAASKLEQSSNGNSRTNIALLDAAMNPLLDLCNGRVDIAIGGLDCLLTAITIDGAIPVGFDLAI